MSTWRLLDTGVLTAAENIAIDEVLLEEKARGNSPDTIRFLQFSPPAVLVGYSQSVEQEVRLDYCREEKIHINRRITGGGAIFLDESQVGWEIICDRSFFDYGIANPEFFSRLSQPIIHALGKLGIDAAFRPRNDIEVKGRKISGTGGTEEGKAFFFQGTLLVDFDAERMFRALRVPVEKLKTREIETAKDRVTCLRWELGRAVGREELKILLKEAFEKVFAITLVEGELTQQEREAIARKKPFFESTDHIDRIKHPEESQPLLYSIYKARGGLIRCCAAVNVPAGRLRQVLFTGDFFAYPRRMIFDLEAALKDVSLDTHAIEEKIIHFFEDYDGEFPGITPADFINALSRALEKMDIVRLGIPIAKANRIFTVRGTFQEVAKTSPSHLLLPYCSKAVDCNFRNKNDCELCGRCDIGEAYRVGKERDLEVSTIISFEDLMQTLDRLRTGRRSSYIGCCCEAFYRKHIDDLENAAVPGILMDIDSTTCYDLGKESRAYRGDFENQTQIDLDLLKRVLDVVF